MPKWLSEGPVGPGDWAPSLLLLFFCCFFFLQFHYENTRAQFFVEDASTASAIKAVNYKILDQDNRRVYIKGLAGGGTGTQGTRSLSWDLAFFESTLP